MTRVGFKHAALLLGLLALPAACGGRDGDDRQDRSRTPRAERAAEGDRRDAAAEDQADAASANLAGDNAGSTGQLAAAPAAPTGVSREWFAGAWTDTGDCADAGQFFADGQYRLADGTRGMWNVRGGRLIVQTPQGRNEVQLRRAGDDTVEIVNADGSVGRSTRC